MRDLYVILSVTGWAWCLVVAALLWVRLRSRRGATDGTAATAAHEARPEAEA